MPTFKKTAQDEQKFSAFIERVNKAIETLSPYSDYVDLNQLKKVCDNFQNRIVEFYRDDRKLNIGIIGQVKAGKSTFLNTLLFNGKKVLPSAATPKTATLTRIEYAEENKLIVEYYTADEWRIIEQNSAVESLESEFVAAREILKMCKEKGIIPAELIARKTDEFSFESAEELMDRLDDFVGENGTYTALVKCTTIHINKPELRDISVVDTPGLNDAIVSRTDATRKFLEYCDVVFFLSRASQFLDQNDMRLLTSQLPQNGVKKIVMICSRFDDGLQDTIDDCDSIEEAIADTKKSLCIRAKRTFENVNLDPALTAVTVSCKSPIFISSICCNMSRKSSNDYDIQEQHVLDNINQYGDVTPEVLKAIGNIEEVENIYDEVVAAKDETLSRKAGDFVPNAERDFVKTFKDLRERTEKKANALKSNDREELIKQKNEISIQINGVKGNSEAVFGEVLAKIEKSKIETLSLLRDLSNDYAHMNEKTGTENHATSYRVSDAKWYKPWTWGKHHTEYSTYTTSYSYLDASDALENIRIFINDACSHIEHAFSDNVDIIGMKRQLLNVVVNNIDVSSDMYDPGLFRYVTEQTLSRIEFPILKIDCAKEQGEISSKFTGEVRNDSDRSALRVLLASAITNVLSIVDAKFINEVTNFRNRIEQIKSDYTKQLLNNIEGDFNSLISQLENKDNEIRNYENLLVLFGKIKLG